MLRVVYLQLTSEMSDKKHIRIKLIQLFGKEKGASIFKRALIAAAKNYTCFDDEVVNQTKGKLQRIQDIQDQGREERVSVYTVNAGLPGLGKKR